MEPNTTIPRVSDRRPLRLMVKSRVESRAIHADMIDISEGGCKIRGTDGFASVGDRVTMKVANMHAPVGHVAWVEGRLAGVAFEGKIHEAVLDHLINAQHADIQIDRDNRRYI